MPQSIYESCCEATLAPKQKSGSPGPAYSASFNVAAWLKITNHLQSPVSLWLQVFDQKGKKEIYIDKGQISAGKHLLLTSKVGIKFKGFIREMRVGYTCDAFTTPIIEVDELFVQAVDSARNLSPPIASV